MSGGHYNYAYQRIRDLAQELRLDGENRVLRIAFRDLLFRCADAAEAIEWNDSGDGDDRERERLEAAVGRELTIATARTLAREIIDELNRARRQR
jgi:hypothetical protein